VRPTPILEKISEYLKHTVAGFHTPGHRQGEGCLPEFRQLMGGSALNMDLTEVPGLDNLKNPEGCLKESQALAAKLYEAVATFYLVNGSTAGLQAALLAVNSPGGKIFIPRHAHISVINGLILSGGEPVLVPVELEKTWGFPLGVQPQVFRAYLAGKGTNKSGKKPEGLDETEHSGGPAKPEAAGELKERRKTGIQENPGEQTAIEAALTVQPTYQGLGFDAAAIRQVFAAQGIVQIVDEAHGAHLFFQKRLPFSLQKEQADLVIQSTHKTLAALTQASMLHVNNPRLLEPVREALNILQTTSPSYLLMASLDSVQAQMTEEGPRLVERAIELAEQLRRQAAEIAGFQVFSRESLAAGQKEWLQDPTKVLVSAAPLGLTGWQLAELLQEKYGLVVEMADYYYVLFLVTIGHRREDIAQVVSALQKISQSYRANRPGGPCLPGGHSGLDSSGCRSKCPAVFYEQAVELAMTPRKVYYNRKEAVNLAEAVGRISGAAPVVYPPGIPCLWPGQLIAKEHVEYLEWALQNNLQVQGLTDQKKIVVCR